MTLWGKKARTDITNWPLDLDIRVHVSDGVSTEVIDLNYITTQIPSSFDHIGGIMVSMLASIAVDRGFEPRSGKTKDNKIGICCFSSKHTTTRYDYNLTIMKSPKPATDTIYPHIKFWWYRTMLNFYPPFLCCVLAVILKMADILNCSSNGDLSLCQILCLYHYPVRSYQH